jgi:hypothetical protein
MYTCNARMRMHVVCPQPAGGVKDIPFAIQPIVAVHDAGDNIVTTAVNPVSLIISVQPAGITGTGATVPVCLCACRVVPCVFFVCVKRSVGL